MDYKPTNARFVFCPKADLRNEIGEELSDLLFEYQLNFSKFNVIPYNLFSKTSSINPSFLNNSSQFIIVNDSLIIQHILTDRAQIFTEKSIVNKYLDHFNYCFQFDSKIKIPAQTKNWKLTKEGNYLIIGLGNLGINNKYDVLETAVFFNDLSANLYPNSTNTYFKNGVRIVEQINDKPDITICYNNEAANKFTLKSQINNLSEEIIFKNSIDAERHYFSIHSLPKKMTGNNEIQLFKNQVIVVHNGNSYTKILIVGTTHFEEKKYGIVEFVWMKGI